MSSLKRCRMIAFSAVLLAVLGSPAAAGTQAPGNAELMRQPDLDEAAVKAALADLRASTTRIQELVHRLLLDVARDLPPEERAAWHKRWSDGLLPGKSAEAEKAKTAGEEGRGGRRPGRLPCPSPSPSREGI